MSGLVPGTLEAPPHVGRQASDAGLTDPGLQGWFSFPIPLIFYLSPVGSFGCLCVWLILETVPTGGNYLFGSGVLQRSRCRERTTCWEDKHSYPDLFITHNAPAVKATDAMLRRQGIVSEFITFWC